MFTQWENETIPVFYIKELSVTEEIFDSSVKVEFTSKCDNNLKSYINNWYKTDEIKSIILSWESKKNKRIFFLFKKGFPNLVNIDNQGNLTSFKFKFKSCHNITRKYKITVLLNDLVV